jgi:predicted DNA-binding protein (UPF0251 family)
MGKIYCKIDMEKVKKIISQKGYYFICTKVLYPDFIGPEYIIVSDDLDITVKYPKTKGMIIVSVEKFVSMAEAYNRYYKNDVKHLRRIERSYEEDGYSEECIEEENGEAHNNLPDVDLHPVEESVEEKDRITLYYFKDWTYAQIGEKYGVSHWAISKSIRTAEKKMKKYLEKGCKITSLSSL